MNTISEMIDIEVVYGLPHKQVLLTVSVPKGTSIEQCLHLSGITQHFPEIIINKAKVGIFSRIENLDYLVKTGDRIEIYRPLTADPKAMRKLRAAKMAKKEK
ncbi:RnfH family protein [Psychromonas sp. CD1]|uniref:RnfH family protein n=1 Tax=Psychromonas sp. CD1 TaxID=1979839 RepID=UPI000B9B7FE0|nr:RnfH family protein [Psychromonas sp. CD1]